MPIRNICYSSTCRADHWSEAMNDGMSETDRAGAERAAGDCEVAAEHRAESAARSPLQPRATGNSRFNTAKFPREVRKYPKIRY